MMSDKGNVFQVKFIDKPKGLRFNSAMSRDIREKGIEYMDVDLGRFDLVLKPAICDDENNRVNKVLFSGEVAQIASAELYDEFSKRGLTNIKVIGDWRGGKTAYEFDLVPQLLGSEYKEFAAGADKTLPSVDRKHKLSVTTHVPVTDVRVKSVNPQEPPPLGEEVFTTEEEEIIYDETVPV